MYIFSDNFKHDSVSQIYTFWFQLFFYWSDMVHKEPRDIHAAGNELTEWHWNETGPDNIEYIAKVT